MLKSDFRKKGVCPKSVTKTFYGNKCFVSEYIFKLVYYCKGSRWSDICCVRDIAKKSLNRLLLLLPEEKISQISQENTCVGVFLK